MTREEFEHKLVDLVSEYLETGEDLEWDENADMCFTPQFKYDNGLKVDIEISFTKPYLGL